MSIVVGTLSNNSDRNRSNVATRQSDFRSNQEHIRESSQIHAVVYMAATVCFV